jgi:hypothetical protein
MTKELKTKIGGYNIELEFDVPNETGTYCLISKGNYSASLAALESTGVLTDGDNELAVPGLVTMKIADWALNNGY